MPGRNKSVERFLEMCAEQELVVGNSWFKKKDLYYMNTLLNYTLIITILDYRMRTVA